ncbi:hypothetical protein P4639_07505 [Priestia megaterium]|uniref:hypothetical protein n=1 Tax=Priestia megaterium TaxID=1404 RepID=UPI002E20EC47|nr:hypothetical protein [Priestia megaterium]
MNRKKAAIKNSGIGGISQLISLVFQMVNRTIFIQYLGVELLGLSSTFISLLNALSLAELGFQTAIVYSLYKPLNENNRSRVNKIVNIFKIVYRWIGFIFIFASIGCLPFLKYIISDIHITSSVYIYFMLLAINSACTYFLAYKRTLLYADQRDYISKLIDVIFNILFSIARIIVVVLYQDYIIYLALQIAQTIFSNLLVHFYCNKMYPYLHAEKLDREIFSKVWGDVKNVFASKVAGYVYSSTDSLVISAFISTVSVGFLVNYTIITSNIKTLTQSLLAPITPIIGRMLANSDEHNDKQKVFYLYTHIRFILASVLLIPTTILIRDVIIAWVGEGYVLSNVVVLFLIADLYIHLVQGVCIDYIYGNGLFKYDKYIAIIGAVMKISLSISMAFIWGLEGVVLSTAITQVFYWISRSIIVFKFCFPQQRKDFLVYWGKNIYSILTFILVYTVSVVAYSKIELENFFVKFILGGILCELIFIFIYFIMYSKSAEHRQLFSFIRKKRSTEKLKV